MSSDEHSHTHFIFSKPTDSTMDILDDETLESWIKSIEEQPLPDPSALNLDFSDFDAICAEYAPPPDETIESTAPSASQDLISSQQVQLAQLAQLDDR